MNILINITPPVLIYALLSTPPTFVGGLAKKLKKVTGGVVKIRIYIRRWVFGFLLFVRLFRWESSRSHVRKVARAWIASYISCFACDVSLSGRLTPPLNLYCPS